MWNLLQKLFKKNNMSVNINEDIHELPKPKDNEMVQQVPEITPQLIQMPVGGFSQETWDKVENMRKESVSYLQKYGEDIAMSVFQHLRTNNSFEIYKNGIVTYCKEIDKLERRCNVTPACSNGCAYCCQQIIYLTEIEKEIVKKKLSQLSKEEQEQIKEKNNKVMSVVRENNIPNKLDMGSNRLDKTNEKYMKFKMPCPLLDDNNSCSVYEVRPTSCWIYKNYGNKEDCNGRIAKHSYPFLEYAQILLGPFMRLNMLRTGKMNYETELLYKVIYDHFK